MFGNKALVVLLGLVVFLLLSSLVAQYALFVKLDKQLAQEKPEVISLPVEATVSAEPALATPSPRAVRKPAPASPSGIPVQ
jgi:hypothetical protein